jgi:hypothetical protein
MNFKFDIYIGGNEKRMSTNYEVFAMNRELLVFNNGWKFVVPGIVIKEKIGWFVYIGKILLMVSFLLMVSLQG